MANYYYRGNPNSCCPSGSSGSVFTLNGGGSMSGDESIVNIRGDGYAGGQINLYATNTSVYGELTLTSYPNAGYLYTNSDGYIEIGAGTPITYNTPLAQDLDGYLPNAFVVGLYGTPIANVSPVVGYALVYNGTNYAPAPAGGTGADFNSFLLMGA